MCPGRPVDVEWLKAYNSVMKFKENVITMMEEHTEAIPQLSNLIDNLKSMEKLTMDKYVQSRFIVHMLIYTVF